MKILINRTDALGDLILTLPLAEFLKTVLKMEVHFMVRPYAAPLLEHSPYIDRVHLYDGKFSTLQSIFFKEHFSHYLYVGGEHLVSCAAFCARVPIRLGLKSRLASFLFLNKGVRQKRSKALKNEVDYNFDLLGPILKESVSFKRGPVLFLTPEELNLYKTRYGKFCVVHPWMKNRSKNWPLSFYTQLIELLLKEKIKVVVNYTSAEQERLKELNLTETDSLIFHKGDCRGLRDSMALIANAQFFVAQSTGPMHIASALGVSTFSCFSPISTQSARRWGPVGPTEKNTLFTPSVECPEQKKCSEYLCSSFDCMERISVLSVFQKIKETQL